MICRQKLTLLERRSTWKLWYLRVKAFVYFPFLYLFLCRHVLTTNGIVSFLGMNKGLLLKTAGRWHISGCNFHYGSCRSFTSSRASILQTKLTATITSFIKSLKSKRYYLDVLLKYLTLMKLEDRKWHIHWLEVLLYGCISTYLVACPYKASYAALNQLILQV